MKRSLEFLEKSDEKKLRTNEDSYSAPLRGAGAAAGGDDFTSMPIAIPQAASGVVHGADVSKETETSSGSEEDNYPKTEKDFKHSSLSKDDIELYQRLGIMYEDTESFSTKFTADSSSGVLSIEQIIRGKTDIFIDQIAQKIFKKKKIIVRDWFLSHLEEEIYPFKDNKSEVLALLFYQTLLMKGFELFYYIDNRLEKIEYISELNNITFVTIDEVKQAAVEIGFTSDEIYIAGVFDSIKFSNQHVAFEIKNILKLSENFHEKFLYEIENKNDINFKVKINQAQEDYILEEFSTTTKKILSLINIVYTSSKTLDLPMLKLLTSMHSYNFEELNEYDDSDATPTNIYDLDELISSCPNLKDIKLNNWVNITDLKSEFYSRNYYTLSKLEITEYYDQGNELSNLKDLVNKLPNLQYFKYFQNTIDPLYFDAPQNTVDINDIISLKDTIFPSSLRTLELLFYKINLYDLQNSLAHSSNLETLSIIKADVFNPTNNKFKIGAIYSLTLSELTITKPDLINILTNTPQIKNLSISECSESIYSGDEESQQQSADDISYLKIYSELETLNIFWTQYNLIDFLVSDKYTNLISLLIDYKIISSNQEGYSIIPISINSLELYDAEPLIEGPCEKFVDLSHLTNLKTLYIRNYSSSSFTLPFSINKITLESDYPLKEYQITNLEECKDLKEIEIDILKSLIGDKLYNTIPTTIESLNIGISDINLRELERVIQKTTNLKHLSLIIPEDKLPYPRILNLITSSLLTLNIRSKDKGTNLIFNEEQLSEINELYPELLLYRNYYSDSDRIHTDLDLTEPKATKAPLFVKEYFKKKSELEAENIPINLLRLYVETDSKPQLTELFDIELVTKLEEYFDSLSIIEEVPSYRNEDEMIDDICRHHNLLDFSTDIIYNFHLPYGYQKRLLLSSPQYATNFLGKILLPNNGGIFSLPSIHPSEKLLKIECIPNQISHIYYSESENLYYIHLNPIKFKKLDSESKIIVKFLLEVPLKAQEQLRAYVQKPLISHLQSISGRGKFIKQLSFDEDGKLNNSWLYSESDENKIRLLTEYCRNFTEKKLNIIPDKDLFTLIMEQQAGVCTHRSLCFSEAAKALNIQARLVKNKIHNWVEVFQFGKWNTIDLGGGEQNIQLEEFASLTKEKLSFASSTPAIPTKTPLTIKKKKEIKDNIFLKNTTSRTARSINDYFESLLDEISHTSKRNILLTMNSKQIEDFYSVILELPYDSYFISNLDEVSLKDVYIEDGKRIESDSRLAKFIKSNTQGFLMIDWSKCESHHIGLNSIIDKIRNIEGLNIGVDIIVISLLEHHVKMGEDFYTRQHVLETLPTNLLLRSKDKLPSALPATEINSAEIIFYNEDWRHVLYGKLSINETGYYFRRSELIKQIESGKNEIILVNAPWSNKDFRLAFKEINEKSFLYANGHKYECKHITFGKLTKPYKLDNIEVTDFDAGIKYDIVNIYNFSSIFECFTIVDGRLTSTTSLKQPLLITDNLSDEAWGKLASLGESIKITLGMNVQFLKHPKGKTIIKNDRIKLIETNDLGMALESLKTDKVIIHVNKDTKLSDLIEKITYEPETGIFSYKINILAQSLLEGKDVVLIGTLANSLIKLLEPLFSNQPYMMVNGIKTEFIGSLTVISEKLNIGASFQKTKKTYTESQIKEKINAEFITHHEELIKLDYLLSKVKSEIISLGNFNYTQIKTILIRMIQKPYSNPLKSILRLKENYQVIKPQLEEIWQSCNAPHPKIIKSRVTKIKEELTRSPYVFLVGPSGVGKSRIIQKELAKEYEVYERMESINILTQREIGGRPRLLFIDEANLAHSTDSYEIFKGLFDRSGLILVNGQLLPVAPGNKIIFAGNYGHFKGRNRIKLVEEHGSIISFKELNDEALYSEVMMPIFRDHLATISPEDPNLQFFINLTIKTYHHINNIFLERHPLTARNLQMICLRYKILLESGKITDLNLLATLAIYDEVSCLFNKSLRNKFKYWLEAEAKTSSIKTIKAELKSEISISGEIVTKSRKNLIRLLNNLMITRDLKTGLGTNGILIEGPSGIGKSYIVKKFLESKGFENGAINESAEKKYYLITPTKYKNAKDTLERAFEEGSIVIIDEINTMPLEDILNPLLSGVNLAGKESLNKGFTIIGTQNPISFGNRIAFSDALKNRFQKIYLKDLQEEEIVELLGQYKGVLEDSWVAKVAKDFSETVICSAYNNFSKPNLRHLFSLVEEKLHGR